MENDALNFLNLTAFEFHDGLYFDRNFNGDNIFEKKYLALRTKEGRLYDDILVQQLPFVPASHPLAKEWTIRRRSAERLARYFAKRRFLNAVEIGSGNGWLTNFLSAKLPLPIAGIDVNVTELKQAARLFGQSGKTTFVCTDIFQKHFIDKSVSVFILAGSIQYFERPEKLMDRLFELLRPAGEIHIVDTPFYTSETVAGARARSKDYFSNQGLPENGEHYFHHTSDFLRRFDVKIVYNPVSIAGRLRRVVRTDSPFPWIRIKEKS